jgi:Transposase and inactivated derivatives
MAKLTYEDKKEIIRLYDEEHLGYILIARKMKVTDKVVEKIIRKFHMHGEDALKKKKNRDFSADLKLEIIKRVLNGESKSSVAIEYNIEPSQIRLWLKKYNENGYNGLINKPKKGRPPTMNKEKKVIDPNNKDALLKAKDERILELEAEVEALKKLKALVLQRNKQQIKKKQ